MRKIIDIVLILGFLFIDFIFFHDIFKVGETTSLGQWLTGILSVLVFAVSIQSLLKNRA
jgi:ABC-type Na+ efflux pump permease subunit